MYSSEQDTYLKQSKNFTAITLFTIKEYFTECKEMLGSAIYLVIIFKEPIEV